MFSLSNKNVRTRYIEEKARAKIAGEKFTYQDMAKMFDTDDRTVYTWVTRVEAMQHLPSNETKRAKLSAWINDGTIGRKK